MTPNDPSRYFDEAMVRPSFESICRQLRQIEHATTWTRTLADWVQRSDRRLPLPFMHLAVGVVIHTPFAQLLHTPTIGRTKLCVLVTLLHRAAASRMLPDEKDTRQEDHPVEEFDVDQVTEVIWDTWRNTAIRLELGDVLLGQVARALSRLPKPLWSTPLSAYLDLTLRELRSQKWFGRIRLACVLEVFYDVHQTLAAARPSCAITFELKSALARRLEKWLRVRRDMSKCAVVDELVTGLIDPLLAQLQVDLDDAHVAVARVRLGTASDRLTMREQAKRLNIARARMYQKFNACSEVIALRWPSGGFELRSYEEFMRGHSGDVPATELLHKVAEFFYPQKLDGAIAEMGRLSSHPMTTRDT